MKTYKEVIAKEGRIALSAGFGGEGTEPSYHRVDMIAWIFGKGPETVRRDIIESRDSRETYRRVAGKDRGY